jgi:hypothetical protein
MKTQEIATGILPIADLNKCRLFNFPLIVYKNTNRIYFQNKLPAGRSLSEHCPINKYIVS